MFIVFNVDLHLFSYFNALCLIILILFDHHLFGLHFRLVFGVCFGRRFEIFLAS